MERDPEDLRLVLAGHRGFDGLGARGDGDAVPLSEQLIERTAFEVGTGKAWDKGFRDVEDLHRHRRRIRKAESLDPEQSRLRRNAHPVGKPGAGESRGELEGAASRRHSATAHVLAERGESQRLGDLGLGHIGAAAVTPVEVAVADQVVEGRPQREAGNPQVDRKLAFGRDRLPDLVGFDQVEDAVPRLLLLTHANGASGIALQPSSSAKVKHKSAKWSIPLYSACPGTDFPSASGQVRGGPAGLPE